MATSPNSRTTATTTSVATSTTSAQLFAANGRASARTVWNNSAVILYVKFGTTASATDAVVPIAAGAYYEFPQPLYAGVVHGILASGTGTALATEY